MLRPGSFAHSSGWPGHEEGNGSEASPHPEGRILALLIPLGGLVLTAAGTASSDAGVPAANGSASLGSAGTADAVADARTRRGKPPSCQPDREEYPQP